jgi:hypothetical protein
MSATRPPGIPPQLLASLAASASANVVDLFANQFRVGVTLTDFTLVFGVGVESQIGGQAVVDKASIHVAPGMLKQILASLQMAMSAYEEVLGEIPIPKRHGHFMDGIRKALVEGLQKSMAGPIDAEISATDRIRPSPDTR